MKLLTLATAAAALAAPALAAPNLVTNGDFNAGNSGFASDYTYIAPPPGPFALYPESAYTVGTNSADWHNLWASVAGEGGSGNYQIVNGAITSGRDVWRTITDIAVTANTDYFFEAFATNICCSSFLGSGSALTFSITGNVTGETTLATFNTAGAPIGTWTGFSNAYNSGANTSVSLRLINASLEATGNDFGLDTINFSERSVVVPAPGALALLGLGLVGIAARRRRAA